VLAVLYVVLYKYVRTANGQHHKHGVFQWFQKVKYAGQQYSVKRQAKYGNHIAASRSAELLVGRSMVIAVSSFV
jgi:hypothetical protein